jgi:amino acid transporter
MDNTIRLLTSQQKWKTHRRTFPGSITLRFLLSYASSRFCNSDSSFFSFCQHRVLWTNSCSNCLFLSICRACLFSQSFFVLINQDFGLRAFGPIGGVIFALCVAMSCFGALYALTYTTAHLVYAAGRNGSLPSFFGILHPKCETPVNGLLLEGILTSILVIVGTFQSLIMFSGLLVWIWYFVITPIFDSRAR